MTLSPTTGTGSTATGLRRPWTEGERVHGDAVSDPFAGSRPPMLPDVWTRRAD